MKHRSSLLLIIFAFFLLFPAVSNGSPFCACCSEPGHYSISVRQPDSYEMDEIKKLRFKGAGLYLTAAGEDGIKGLGSITDTYSVDSIFGAKFWKFDFRDENEKPGFLNLRMPSTMVAFAADIHDGQTGGGGGPLLYKEWRFKNRVSEATGIFQKGMAPKTEYFLVLQGRGNVCTSAEDFTNWRLEITGKKANYAFFGDFEKQAD
ncbi:MAG: hypothetical protein R2747_07480 [Pyrinomonadaceae bacterium]